MKPDKPAMHQRVVYEETVEHTSHCEFFLKYAIRLLFGSGSNRQNLPQRSPPFFFHTAFTNHIRLRLAFIRTSWKTPFSSRTNL